MHELALLHSVVDAEIGGRAVCSDCDREIGLPNLLASCPCGSFRVQVIAGQELRVKEVEVV